MPCHAAELTDSAAILAELRELRRLVEALVPRATDAAADFCAALAASYGTSTAFYACDVIEFCQAQPALRRDLQQSLQRLCGTDCPPTAQQLGMALQRLVRAPPAGFAVEATARRGTTQWLVSDLRGRVPPAPQDAPAR